MPAVLSWPWALVLFWLSAMTSAGSAAPINNPVWQLGEFFTGGREFQPMTDTECVYSFASGVHRRDLPVARFLGGTKSGTCRRLRLRFTLDRGCYALVRSIKEPEEQGALLCQVFFNSRELGCLYTARLGQEILRAPARAGGVVKLDGLSRLRSSVRILDTPPGYQCAVFPFVCTEAGEQEITLSMESEVNAGKRLELDALALVECLIDPRPHSLSLEIPGRVFLDLWGWQATTWYQRRKMAGPEYFQDKMIAESFARGANFIQLHPSLDQPQWGKAGFDAAALLRNIHEHDMAVDEHCFPQNRKTADEMLSWIERWAKISSNFPEHGWKGSVDGFEGEAFNALFEDPTSLKALTDSLWRWNPGSWANHAGFPCTATWLSRPRYRTPNYLKGPVCLHFLGLDLGPDEYKVGIEGYDDKLPLFRPFPGCQGLHTTSQKIYLGYQADCRIDGTEISRSPARLWGGRTRPDWILKQADDFFRARAQWPEDPHESAIYWLGEPPETLPLEHREVVYAASQDPIKHAMAATHAHGGVGGVLDRQREEWEKKAEAHGKDPTSVEWWQLRRRSEFAAQTHFIQNAYLRLNLTPDQEGGVLQYDLERLAHFDSDSLSLPLTQAFLGAPLPSAQVSGQNLGHPHSQGAFRQAWKIEKPGGHLAVLLAEQNLPLPTGWIKESRRYLLPNDAPYLVMELARTSHGHKGTVSLKVGCEGYDTLLAAQKTVKDATTFERTSIPQALQFRDSSGFKPDLSILFLSAGNTSSVRWQPGQSLILEGAPHDELKLAWVIPTDLYTGRDHAGLSSALKKLVRPLSLGAGGAELRNTDGVAHIAVARIESDKGGPYLVRENEWWTVRGAQRGIFGPDRADYIKLCFARDAAVRVLPYGFIDGAAKPGYGCQYALALRDVKGDASGAACKVRVFSVTPFLFAPRIEFARPVARVTLNGRPWHYFDDQLVFLPNQTGVYGLQVWYGEAKVPSLARTYALVRASEWDGQTLRITVDNQDWAGELPSDVYYYAWVRAAAGAPATARHAQLIESRNDLCLVRFRPGTVELTWK